MADNTDGLPTLSVLTGNELIAADTLYPMGRAPQTVAVTTAQIAGTIANSSTIVPNANGGTGVNPAATGYLTNLSPNTYNIQPGINLQKWRAALAKVKYGGGNARLVCLGNSTTFGVGSNGLSTGNYQLHAYPTDLTARFNALGINAHCNSWLATGPTMAQQIGMDGRLTYTADWSATSAVQTIGGNSPGSQSITSNGYLSFTPAVNVDTFNLFYIQSPNGTRSFDYNVNGGSNTNVNVVNAAGNYVQISTTTTLASNTLNVAWHTGSTGITYVAGMEAYDSSKSWVSVMNAGWRTSKASDWSSTTLPNAGPTAALKVLAPALTLIDLTINDWNAATSLTAYMASLQTIITAAQVSGDVILITGNPSNPALDASMAQQQIYVNAVYNLATTNNIGLIDVWGRWGSYSSATALGMTYDDLHPNGIGYQDISQFIANIITTP